MRQSEPGSDDLRNSRFLKIVDGFLLQQGLPLASVLTAWKTDRIINFCLRIGQEAFTKNPGDDFRARAKLSEPAIRDLSSEIANDAEHLTDDSWLWKGRHVKLVDSVTFTMPDTIEDVAKFPQPRTEKKMSNCPSPTGL